eukprot:364193-Chlamydomonas_euryale.AAC.2
MDRRNEWMDGRTNRAEKSLANKPHLPHVDSPAVEPEEVEQQHAQVGLQRIGRRLDARVRLAASGGGGHAVGTGAARVMQLQERDEQRQQCVGADAAGVDLRVRARKGGRVQGRDA